MSVEELYRMNKVRFDQLTFKEKYYKYLETDEWKEISKRLRRLKNKCSSCGYTYDLVVHHLNYDNVDLFNVGNEFFQMSQFYVAGVILRHMMDI